MKGIIGKIMLLILSIFIASFIIDRGLTLLGFSTESPPQYAHPPNFKELRKNFEFEYHFQTNSKGLRYKEIPLKKPKGTHRIFVVGDSITEGWGVNDNQRFTSFLENHFKEQNQRISFINGGLSGTGPLQFGRLFYNVGLRYYDLDGLLICLFPNDVIETPESAKPVDLYLPLTTQYNEVRRVVHALWPRTYTLADIFLRQYRTRQKTNASDFVKKASEKALRRGIAQERIEEWKARLPRHLVDAVKRGEYNGSILIFGLIAPEYWTDSLDIDSKKAEAKWQAMVNILSEMTNQGRKNELDIGIVFIPAPVQYYPFFHEDSDPWVQVGVHIRSEWLTAKSELQKRLEIWTKEIDLPFLDLTPVLRQAAQSNPNLNWKLDGHFTPEGHRFVGQEIAQWLEDEDMLSFIKKN